MLTALVVGAAFLESASHCDVAHTKWNLAMVEEIAALERIGTLDIIYVPPRVRLITWWVYKIKTRYDGSLEGYKVRNVARGFQQKHGADYDETFCSCKPYDLCSPLVCVPN